MKLRPVSLRSGCLLGEDTAAVSGGESVELKFGVLVLRRYAGMLNPHNPDDHPDYAYSTYNLHTDGSGVCTSSRQRPILTMRPNFLTIDDPHGSGVRHLSAAARARQAG